MSFPRSRCFLLPAAVACILVPLALASAQTGPDAQPAPRPASSAKHSGKPCVPVADAVQSPNKDLCVSAHVYQVVELTDGTRFLDVCPANLADDQCRFTLLSLREDRGDVGDLRRFRDRDIEVRGIVRATHGRMGIVISHVRQFSGGPEKFKPNPKLLRGFNGQSDRMPVRDPNLAPSGRQRSFMNHADTTELPAPPRR